MVCRRVITGAVLSIVLLARFAGAQSLRVESPSAGGAARLPLADVVRDVLAAHPELRVAEARAAAARQRPAQVRGLPDPMLSTAYASTGRPYPGAGLGTDPNAWVGAMVSQELPLAGKRQARAAVLDREAEADAQQADMTRLALVSRVRQAYDRLAAAWQLDEVLQASETLLGTLVAVSETRYAVGQAPQQDVIRAQTQVSLLALQRERVARERRAREGELNALMRRAPNAPVGRPLDLAPVTLDASIDALLGRALRESPVLRRDALLVARADAEVEVARRDFHPDLGVSAGYRFMGAMPDMFELRVDVVLPLQRARRRAALAERELAASAERHAVEAAQAALQAQLHQEYETVQAASRLALLYRDAVLPQASLALESSVASYQAGRVDFLSVLTNFGSVLEYEMGYVEQLLEARGAAARLEELTAVPLLP